MRATRLVLACFSAVNIGPWVAILSLFAIGCASSAHERMEEQRSLTRAAPAAYYVDGFFLEEKDRPERSRSDKRFYFKDCELVSRKRFPVRAEYECNSD